MIVTEADYAFMKEALRLATFAESQGEVPVGAVIVQDNQIIAEGWNQPISTNDPTAHAEIVALRQAATVIQNYRLTNTTLYVTLEPCTMCIGAILHARITRLVFGATDPRAGAVTSVFHIADETALNHRLVYQGGVLAEDASAMLKTFFRRRR